MNLWTDVMLFVGKLHSAHLFQIDSELVLSNATPATQDHQDTCFKQVGDCETRIADLSEQLSSFQRKLAKLCERKPKGKE